MGMPEGAVTPSPEQGLGGGGNSGFTGAEGLAMRAGALATARGMVEIGNGVLAGISTFLELFDVSDSAPFAALGKKAVIIIEQGADLALASQEPSPISDAGAGTPIDGESRPK